MKKHWAKILIALLVVAIGIQFIPVAKSNPPVTHEVQWANAQTETYFKGACADCHSNETVWPWYTNVAPLSWWIAHHVDEGRDHFNVSVPDMGDYDEAAEAAHDGWMPLSSYTWMHPAARLTPEQRKEFAQGLEDTFNPGDQGDHEDDDH